MAKNSLLKRVEGSVYRTIEGAKRAVGENETVGAITEKVGKMHHDIKESGGYRATVKRTGKNLAGSVRDAYNSVYGSIEKDFFTDGKFDPGKAKAMLGDRATAVRKYGQKGYDKLSALAGQGMDAAGRRYHEFVPTEEELSTKYAGIGTKHEGVLLKDDYEACLAFRAKVEKAIPKGTKFRRIIFQDIMEQGIGSLGDLRSFYARQVTKSDRGYSGFDVLPVIGRYEKKLRS